jgi:hypothetical protein
MTYPSQRNQTCHQRTPTGSSVETCKPKGNQKIRQIIQTFIDLQVAYITNPNQTTPPLLTPPHDYWWTNPGLNRKSEKRIKNNTPLIYQCMNAMMPKASSSPNPTTPPNQTITTIRTFHPVALIIPGTPDSDSNTPTVADTLTHHELMTRLNRRRERRTKRSRRLRTRTKQAKNKINQVMSVTQIVTVAFRYLTGRMLTIVRKWGSQTLNQP